MGPHFLEKTLRFLERVVPQKLYRAFQPSYHFLLALLGALIYRFPSKNISVIAVTGTKGKSSTVEILATILQEAGYTTASLSTIQFRIGENITRNLYKMTTPGRFFVQKFLREAVKNNCHYAILEMTSEASRQYRHRFIDFDAVILTNLSPEHIESHGSFEKYREAKMDIARQLLSSSKKNPTLVINDDEVSLLPFLKLPIPRILHYSAKNAHVQEDESPFLQAFTFEGAPLHTKLQGHFNISNILAAATYALSEGVSLQKIARGVESLPLLRGRMEKVDEGQEFSVFVDYAHTVESLTAVYEAIPEKKICVLGGTGGGRDSWKRKEMGKVAEKYCSSIFLTNEDPYDEDPEAILSDIYAGISSKPVEKVLDRREAIRKALSLAQKSEAVIITGKGTDPYIMGPRGEKKAWDDANVTREELRALLRKKGGE